MADASDSDDSAFLFTNSYKRKARNNSDEAIKKTPGSTDAEMNETVNVNKETIQKDRGSSIIQDISIVVNKSIVAEFKEAALGKSILVDENPKLRNENYIEQKTEIMSSKLKNYYSCPLCLKTFDAQIAHISHMKQCAKKSKMTPKQLLEALEMHKDQLKERINLGLSSPVKKKKKTRYQEDSESSYQLSLGLALSKSLSEVNPNHLENDNAGFNKNITKINKTTLECFGFTSSGCNIPGKKKMKKWKNAQFVLRERTKEERERLITEKAAVILLSKDYEIENYKNTEQLELHDLGYEFKKDNEKKESLWKLGEEKQNTKWYVRDIKDYILDEMTQDYNEENAPTFNEYDIVEEIKGLNLPRHSISQDWRKLINNRHLSDLSFRSKSCETIYLHGVVLYARCPTMLDLDLQKVFSGFSTVTILIFLKYLYCGMLDGLKRSEINNLFELAQSVKFEELSHVLIALQKNLEIKFFKKNENMPEMDRSCKKEESTKLNLENRLCELINFQFNEEMLQLNHTILDPRSNNLTQENVILDDDTEDVKNQSIENILKSLKNKEATLLEQCENKILVNHMITEDKINSPLNGKEDKDKSPCSCKNIIQNQGLTNNCGNVDDLEGDMFEEVEILGQISGVSDGLHITTSRFQNNVDECILVSSESSRDGEERGEESSKRNDDLPITDCEIPYFDPYEHFNNEIPELDSPAFNEEQIRTSQSLFLNEISPLKLPSPSSRNSPRSGHKNATEPATVSPIILPSTSQSPDFCSTPINSRSHLSTLTSNPDIYQRKSVKRRQRWMNRSSSIKRNRSVISSRLKLSKLRRSSSLKYKKNILRETQLGEKDSENVADVLSDSVLKELENSFGIASGKTSEAHQGRFIEMTPAVTCEFSDEVSPLPDYSIMQESSIKKHLTKYGLKKSLSKNKAKKILRHIYEELHPLINTRNGKIIKYEVTEKRKRSTKKSGRIGGEGRKIVKNKKPEIDKEKHKDETGIGETQTQATLTGTEGEDATTYVMNTSTLERTEGHIFERSDSDIQEPLSQTNFSHTADVTEVIFDYIRSNPDIHRRVLMYEPIWLENLRQKLYEKYNKKFKLTDIMDCLDAKCITFRCESQRRTNRSRRVRTKSNKLKNK